MIEEAIKRANVFLEVLKKEFDSNVLKGHRFLLLRNMDSRKKTGLILEIHISSKYDYDESYINEWKSLIGADKWSIRVFRSQLYLRYYINNKS